MNPENEFDDSREEEEEEFSPDPRERDFVAEFREEEVVRHVDNRFYILDENHQLVPAGDLIKWANFFENNSARRVGRTKINGLVVSTVFLGIDHSFGGYGPPLFFETMIFRGTPNAEIEKIQRAFDQYQTRYSTWDEALAGHNQIVTIIREGLF
jgi:hypothetical protein